MLSDTCLVREAVDMLAKHPRAAEAAWQDGRPGMVRRQKAEPTIHTHVHSAKV